MKTVEKIASPKRKQYALYGSISAVPDCCNARFIHDLDWNVFEADVRIKLSEHVRDDVSYTAITASKCETEYLDRYANIHTKLIPGQVKEEKALVKLGFKKVRSWKARTGSVLTLWFRKPKLN